MQWFLLSGALIKFHVKFINFISLDHYWSDIKSIKFVWFEMKYYAQLFSVWSFIYIYYILP